MGRTCGEPDEIGLTPMGVKLNGQRRVRRRRRATGGTLRDTCKRKHVRRVRWSVDAQHQQHMRVRAHTQAGCRTLPGREGNAAALGAVL